MMGAITDEQMAEARLRAAIRGRVADGDTWYEAQAPAAYLRPKVVDALQADMSKAGETTRITEVVTRKAHAIIGLGDFTEMVAKALPLEGYKVNTDRTAVAIHVVRGPLVIPLAPVGTMRSYTVYGRVFEDTAQGAQQFHPGVTYICVGSDPQPVLRPVPATTPILIVTTHLLEKRPPLTKGTSSISPRTSCGVTAKMSWRQSG